MTTPATSQAALNAILEYEETMRLRTLSNEELVIECLEHDHDCVVLDELLRRFWPEYELERSH